MWPSCSAPTACWRSRSKWRTCSKLYTQRSGKREEGLGWGVRHSGATSGISITLLTHLCAKGTRDNLDSFSPHLIRLLKKVSSKAAGSATTEAYRGPVALL